MTDSTAATDRETARRHLRKLFPIGSPIHTLRFPTRAENTTPLVVLVGTEGQVSNVSRLVVSAGVGRRHPAHDAVVMQSMGSRPGTLLTHLLGRALYPDGYACTGHQYDGGPGEYACPSADHIDAMREHGTGHYDPAHTHATDGVVFRHVEV